MLNTLHPLVRDLSYTTLNANISVKSLQRETVVIQNEIDNLPVIYPNIQVITTTTGAIPLDLTLAVLSANAPTTFTLADGTEEQLISISVTGTTTATITTERGSLKLDQNNISVSLVFLDGAWVRYNRKGTTPNFFVTTQQGSKLVGTGLIGGFISQGASVSLSADGNTLAIGASQDNSNVGAVVIFTREGDTWTQDGNKLVGTGYVGTPFQGISVALSANGDTLVVGGEGDNSNVGAVWVFKKVDGVWTQQGSKLVGTGSSGNSFQGSSVAISSDGNTIAVGARGDGSNVGATWIYTRSGDTWTQQGSKLVGTGNTGASNQGSSVALSSDGNTLAVGGPGDNGSRGATWIFVRSGSTWSQQGSKLIGTGTINPPNIQQGESVALSADGNTLAIGAGSDDSFVGATWIFTRSGTTWTQQAKLVGTGGGAGTQGSSVALSADGNTLVVGGDEADSFVGATWIFTRVNTTWSQVGNRLSGSGNVGNSRQGRAVAISAGGNTVAVGGSADNSSVGATWVFV